MILPFCSTVRLMIAQTRLLTSSSGSWIAVAVGAFHHQVIRVAGMIGVAEDVVAAAADVAAERQTDLAVALARCR